MHFIVGTRPEEAEFVGRTGFTVTALAAPRLSFSFPWKCVRAVSRSAALLEEFKPDVIFSKGGYVSVPFCLAAWRRKVPIILHESDAVSGWANWLVSRFAEVVCLGFPGSIRNSRAIFTGIPVREDVIQGSRQKGVTMTGLSRMRPILLVLGGSQGALALNRAVAKNLSSLLEYCDIIHLTGRGKDVVAQNPPGYWQCPFANEEYGHLLAAADLALSRAGATSIMELAAIGLPAILVPLKGVAHNHQTENALRVAAAGGCVLLSEERVERDLVSTVRMFLDAERMTIMQRALHSLSRPDSARQIAGVIARYLAPRPEGA